MQRLLGHQWRAPVAWKPEDAVLFAAAVGADPSTDLDYLDVSRGPILMPTFPAARLSRSGRHHRDELDPFIECPEDTFLLSCDIAILGEPPPTVQTDFVSGYLEIWDKGSSALVVTEAVIRIDSKQLLSLRTTVMVRGQGGLQWRARSEPHPPAGVIAAPRIEPSREEEPYTESGAQRAAVPG